MALKEDIIKALRLNPQSAVALDSEIDKKIATARAEMIRVGCNADVANSDNCLVEDAITTYCQAEMGNQKLYDRYQNAWIYQINNLRQSTITIEEPDDECTE